MTAAALLLCTGAMGAFVIRSVRAAPNSSAPAAPPSRAFRQALPGYRYSFPRDHGNHPEFSTEWWYYTGHLKTADGRRFGYQATWFRTALAPSVQRRSRFAARDIQFAHFALTDITGRRFYFTDRMERVALGLAGTAPGKVWVGDWTLGFEGPAGARQAISLSGESDDQGTRGQRFGIRLDQAALKPPAIHGNRGVSQKTTGHGRASHYYSYTRLDTTGTLLLDGKRLAVTGQSWFDHEFGSNQMQDDLAGWDWFSLHLLDGRDLMLYQLRHKDGSIEPLSSGTLVDERGAVRHLKRADFGLQSSGAWRSSRTGNSYPARWRVEVPSEGLTLEVTPELAAQEMVPRRSGGLLSYWEGAVRGQGAMRGKPVNVQGYLEMTGYGKGLQGVF